MIFLTTKFTHFSHVGVNNFFFKSSTQRSVLIIQDLYLSDKSFNTLIHNCRAFVLNVVHPKYFVK